MKKTLLLFLLALFAAGPVLAQSRADLNDDDGVNVGDVTTLVNMILGKTEVAAGADLNDDGDVNVGDVTTLVNVILGKTTLEEIPELTATEDGYYYTDGTLLYTVTDADKHEVAVLLAEDKDNITEAKIPAKVKIEGTTYEVTSIGRGAFFSCSSLTSVSIPASVQSIGYATFSDCRSLTSIDLPSSLISIGDVAFRGCTSLTSINIPNSVTSIGNGAFDGCTRLTSIVLPTSLTSIGSRAFSNCSLTSVTALITDPSAYGCESSAFEGSFISSAILHVPFGSADAYKAAAPWSGFGSIVEDAPPVAVAGKLFTLQCARGYVYYDAVGLHDRGAGLYGTSSPAKASHFAIVEYGGTTYLYDATSKAFVVHEVAATAGTNGNYTRESATDFSKAVKEIKWGSTGYANYPYYLEDSFGNWLQMDSGPIVYFNTWKNFEGAMGGNTYTATAVGDFDPAEAISMLDAYFSSGGQ